MGPKPAMSITLPRNFTFHYNDGDMPTTPSHQSQESEEHITQPPPPPRQTFKVRRRKADSVPRDIIAELEEDGLPTIEMTEPDLGSSPDSLPEMMPGYLAPQASRLPLLSPPRTPVDQIGAYTFEPKSAEWNFCTRDNVKSPESIYSDISDSSLESFDSSLKSYPSLGSLHFGGLSTGISSPESDLNDPENPFGSVDLKSALIFSPDLNGSSPTAKRAKKTKDARWTQEMDEHLFSTFLQYVGDPELTPFKLLPGTAPPLGVCGRVARQAKQSWKSGRVLDLSTHSRRKTLPNFTNNDEPVQDVKTWSHWPSSEGGTRKRLRKLCKKNASLSAHYQRMIKTRSPSPFESSSTPASEDTARPAPSTMLAAEPASAISSDAMTTDATSSFTTSTAPRKTSLSKPDDWYQRIGRSQTHQKSQSLQLALGGYGNPLASPFDSSSATNDLTPRTNYAVQSLGRNMGPGNNHGPLKSPLELHAPLPKRLSLKRPFKVLDENEIHDMENRMRIDEIFPQQPVATPKAPRDRSLSLSAVFHSSRSFQRHTVDEPMPDVPPIPAHFRVAANDNTRLGSPFTAAPGHQSHTFPRGFNPDGLDLTVPKANMSLSGKFRELAAQEAMRNL